MRRPLAITLAFLSFAATSSVRAAEADPPIGIALAASAATALVPLALGAAFTANASTFAGRNAGLCAAGAGLTLSPVIGHVVLGEYGRAAAFGAAPLAAELGIIALVTARPDAIFSGTQPTRTTFGFLISVDVFGAALSMIDVAMARGRVQEKLPAPLRGLHLAPLGRGFVIGGVL